MNLHLDLASRQKSNIFFLFGLKLWHKCYSAQRDVLDFPSFDQVQKFRFEVVERLFLPLSMRQDALSVSWPMLSVPFSQMIRIIVDLEPFYGYLQRSAEFQVRMTRTNYRRKKLPPLKAT